MHDALRAALDAGDWPRALDLALDAWRASRAVELAELVDAIAAKLPRAAPIANHGAWIARAMPYDPLAVGPLAATASRPNAGPRVSWLAVRDRHPREPIAAILNAIDPTHSPWSDFAIVDRFAAVAAWPDDPRTTAIYAGWLAAMPFVTTLAVVDRFYRVVVDRLVALRDARAAAALARIADEPSSITAVLRDLQQRLAREAAPRIAAAPAPDPIAGELVANLRAPTPPAIDRALWHEIRRAPDDDGPRQVLADALLERGDPRGELIALQLHGGSRERANRLIKEHWRTWLGGLALAVVRRGAVFERGFLVDIRVGMHHTPAWAFDKAWGHDELVAVRAVRAHQVADHDFARFVNAIGHNVACIGVGEDTTAAALAQVRPRWPTRRLDFARRAPRVAGRAPLVDALAAYAELMPELEHVHFGADSYGMIESELVTAIAALPARLPRLTRVTLDRALVRATTVLPPIAQLV